MMAFIAGAAIGFIIGVTAVIVFALHCSKDE